MAQVLEELAIWQDARSLAGQVYRLTRHEQWNQDYGLRDQARRAAVSVMANIAEGFGRRNHREFNRYLSIAEGSLTETESHLVLATDLDYLVPEATRDLRASIQKLRQQIRALRRHLTAG